ncbi:programmed cell death protein 7-like [Penaeus indicus]|uniref:programmed cell death protein 7-like n=1 Tax=Penaeus indicus TaxID=29960 RepID=UPI00300D64E7
MDTNRVPPPVVTNGAPSPVELNNGMNRVPAPVGFNRGPPPMGHGPLPMYFNRGPPPMEMAGPQPYVGFNRGLPPPLRGPPPFGLNREPPPLGFSTPPPPRGAPPPPGIQMPLGSSPQLGHSNIQFDSFSNIPQNRDQLPAHLQSTDDGNGSTQSNLLPPHLHHNPPKRTFQGEHFTVNDFIQPPPPSTVYPPIPHAYQGHASISSQQYYNKGHNTAWHGGPSPSSSSTESSTYQTDIGEETDGLDEDQKWINNFEQRIMQRCQVQPARKNLPTNAVKLSDVQEMIRKFRTLTRRLEELRDEMRENSDIADDHMWNSLVMEAEDIKEKIFKIENHFQDKEFISLVQHLISRRQNKRKKIKKQKERMKRDKEELKLAWQREEEKIDVWREKLEEQEKEKRREKAVELEADSILGEVRQKQTEASRMQQLLESLTTLRQARINKGASHGYLSTPTDDLHFSSTKKGIGEVVATQVKEYQLEEQTLRVMMGESAAQKPSDGNEVNAAVSKREASMRKLLFGDFTPINPDIMKEFTAADDNWETLLQRRFEWDQYGTEENTPLATSIPINWVIPPMHPSEDWAQYQNKAALC